MQTRTPFERLVIFFLVWMGCFLFVHLLAAGFLRLFYGPEVYEILASSELVSGHLNLARFLLIFLSIGIFGIPPLAFVLISKPGDWSFFKLKTAPPFSLAALTVIIIITVAPIVLWALEINQNTRLPEAFKGVEDFLRDLQDKNEKTLEAMLNMRNAADFLINFLMIAIIPALVEELMFRGTLQPLIGRALGNIHLSIFITGMFFSFIHFEFYGFLPRMMLGILFGYLFYWSGNLWLPIFAHFLNNGIQVILVYLFQTGRIALNIDETNSLPTYITVIASLLFVAVVYIFELVARSIRAPEAENGKGLG